MPRAISEYLPDGPRIRSGRGGSGSYWESFNGASLSKIVSYNARSQARMSGIRGVRTRRELRRRERKRERERAAFAARGPELFPIASSLGVRSPNMRNANASARDYEGQKAWVDFNFAFSVATDKAEYRPDYPRLRNHSPGNKSAPDGKNRGFYESKTSSLRKKFRS